ncbi:MAG: 30S ribosomal protein S13 [Candidatus Spechtbacteria bacterium RIFCSPLOWO2_12_FULL_38_22]|uniref:Small ribosomal subunit protein uS13 n=1 Tax=Candidatus Spechtbacteria bacterium RIFCSPLOWO2_12_FULL_38_22 TaxID=1802165 RepID=A0A1G2HIN7_9BACT|nr:MAG: 30S ribosomal protein S13 [Candidatus Spechtbacteria bacterium RIFCSPHIGHO2_01_FULL_38_11]OGZ59232.1 MAG: 30S ribosomal protein S13 [Candidatus Spechtbacteria bacterium RIFCSPHIGHO2_12_FULL_38_30]OGZ60834.1 MAG: 30S ribosomal protein S13 [Candidatus Spechtbacteria bacterium RIFCSPLOWO2_01_FULL_38_20]OGZ62362.1 MAG: 30S ribosomal protein S13 [Candidatus Spechtbacteria bacterium RIFCSPLOWO2_12_FULL_38_22]
MIRIAGADIPENKRAEIALTYIKGIGKFFSNRILTSLSIDKNKKVKDLSAEELNTIRNHIANGGYVLESDLQREVRDNIKRLRDIGSYRGSRHASNLPVRGQRTKTNSRTVRGNKRVTVGSGRKPASTPT